LKKKLLPKQWSPLKKHYKSLQSISPQIDIFRVTFSVKFMTVKIVIILLLPHKLLLQRSRVIMRQNEEFEAEILTQKFICSTTKKRKGVKWPKYLIIFKSFYKKILSYLSHLSLPGFGDAKNDKFRHHFDPIENMANKTFFLHLSLNRRFL